MELELFLAGAAAGQALTLLAWGLLAEARRLRAQAAVRSWSRTVSVRTAVIEAAAELDDRAAGGETFVSRTLIRG